MRTNKSVWFRHMAVLITLLLLSSCDSNLADALPEATRLLIMPAGEASALALDGSTVSGSVMVGLENERRIQQVSFFLDAPSASDEAIHVDDDAPFTFDLDTTSLSNGDHNLTVVATARRRASVRVVANSDFTVSNEKVQPANAAPFVDAGEPQTVTLPADAALQGTTSDDGLPDGHLTLLWSKVSGPGKVSFGSPTELATTASFSVDGGYVLELRVSDGELDATAKVAVDVIAATVLPDPDPDPGPDPDPTPTWQPKPGLTWFWQLSGSIDTDHDVDVYDIDYETAASVVEALHAKGKKVIAYVPVGDWEDYRPDSADFPDTALCGSIDGWPERYIDIRNAKAVSLIKARITLAASKGFDGIEGDVVDLHLSRTGCSPKITEAQMTAYLKDLTQHAHSLGLAYFAKNVSENAADWSGFTDGAVVEEAYQYGEEAGYMPYIKAGKPVFAVEYGTGKPTNAQCADANNRGFGLYGTNLALTGKVYKTCW